MFVSVSAGVWATSTFSPIGLLSSNGRRMLACVCVCVCVCVCACVRVRMCVCGQNKLKCALRWHVHISVHSKLCQRMHTHTLVPSDRELTGLKADTADVEVCDFFTAYFTTAQNVAKSYSSMDE